MIRLIVRVSLALGFTCPAGMRLTALYYSITPVDVNFIRPTSCLLAKGKKSFQTFLLHRIGHPVIGNIDCHLEKRCGHQADLLHALCQLPLPLRVKFRFSFDLLHGHLVVLQAVGYGSSCCSKNESAPRVGKMPETRIQTHLFGNSAIRLC
jgi:hypothetical protein